MEAAKRLQRLDWADGQNNQREAQLRLGIGVAQRGSPQGLRLAIALNRHRQGLTHLGGLHGQLNF